MKILEIGPVLFKLPDDFSGGLSDALRLLADYHELPKTERKRLSRPSKRGTPDRPKEYQAFRESRLGEFFAAVKEGYKVHGSVCMMEGDETKLKEMKWK